MTTAAVRPDISNLVLRSYGRLLHPELLCHSQAVAVQVPGMQLDVRLGLAGHVLILRSDSAALTEVMSDQRDLFPQHGRLFEYAFRGCHTESFKLESGLRYDLGYSLERLSETVFLRQHEELLEDCSRASLSLQFAGTTRFSPGPLSVIRADASRDSILVHAFHTFPDHLSVVKTQSLFEWS